MVVQAVSLLHYCHVLAVQQLHLLLQVKQRMKMIAQRSVTACVGCNKELGNKTPKSVKQCSSCLRVYCPKGGTDQRCHNITQCLHCNIDLEVKRDKKSAIDSLRKLD